MCIDRPYKIIDGIGMIDLETGEIINEVFYKGKYANKYSVEIHTVDFDFFCFRFVKKNEYIARLKIKTFEILDYAWKENKNIFMSEDDRVILNKILDRKTSKNTTGKDTTVRDTLAGDWNSIHYC